ncbi:MAG: hypothetical protein KGJ66_06310 [Alphaproteobacteria bacterium]|nr:hypothetical protein [Alphaproteobacteria bacterium]
MRGLAVLINVFIPGIGTLMVGKVGQGIAQFILWAVGVAICFTVIGVFIGVPMAIAAWIWAIVSAASNPAPIQVEVTHRRSSETPGKN